MARRLPLLLLPLLPLLVATPGSARLLEDVDYRGAGDPHQTLDLFLPSAESAPDGAPLLAFVHSRFWGLGDRRGDLAQRFARPLQRAGAAVAIVRHRPAESQPHPAGAEDVAAALAFLRDAAASNGIDPERIYLAGHGAGAHLAALVALDPAYLAAHDQSPDALRGVAVWSGLFDLETGDASLRAVIEQVFDGATLREASPLRHARADAPLFLLMVAQQDLPDAAGQAEAFTAALREAGHPAAEMFFLNGRDHWSGLDLTAESGPARQHLLALMGLPGATGPIEHVFATRRFWRDPSARYSTQGFWDRAGDRAVRHEADDRLHFTLNLPFARPGRPMLLRPQHYHAVDLLEYVERFAPGGGGSWRFLTVTNVRGEQMVWRRDELEPLAPRLVIGIDERRELFSLADTYHTRRRYTWQGEPAVWLLARPLGAFVHFPEPPPDSLDPKLFGRFGLQPDSFAVSREDPWAALRDLPEPERSVVLEELRCVSCHQLRGAGARAGHLRARDGELVGGFGLPLTDYPPEVWRRYCFEQVEVAAEIGATPVSLDAHAQALFELVERERDR